MVRLWQDGWHKDLGSRSGSHLQGLGVESPSATSSISDGYPNISLSVYIWYLILLILGYIPTADALRAISNLVTKVKAENPGLIYLLDPVVGDEGRPYVPAEVIPIYRELLPQATIITPNWYEVE